MNFEFSEEQNMFRRAIRDFSRTVMAPLVPKAEKDEDFPVHLFKALGELGYLCVSYPAEYGAAGLGLVESCIVCEEMGEVALGIQGNIMVQSGIATSAIRDHGSEDLKTTYLRPAIRGKKIAALGLTEVEAGSDVASMKTTAALDGNHYVVSGTKMYISNGSICDFLTVAAYTDKAKGHKGISLFAVDRDTVGLSCSRLRKFCHRSSDTAEVVFDKCIVPREHLIGEEGAGFRYLMETLDSGRITHAASRVGAARSVFEATLTYAQQRIQFGRPIATFQANGFKLARMAMDIESARWMVYHAAWLYDQHRPCTKEAAMAKLAASETYQKAAVESMQIHGGAAVLEESPINRHYRDSYVARITEGTSEIQEIVIARQLGIKV